MSSKAIGIDLGTTYSCVGVWQNGRVEIIANDQGNRTTPSYVAFANGEVLIGDGAKNQVAGNPYNTVYDAKRLIGRTFTDPIVQNDIKHYSFKVVNQAGKPYIRVTHKDEEKDFAPEQISAFVLQKMKATAEAYLGHPVTDAVITVPAYFNDQQRKSTKDAGAIAGLNVLRIINEPTAAAIAYGLDKDHKGSRNILIFDCGGGTHDVSLLTLDDGVFEVKATNGDSHLGGEDIDNILVEHCSADFQRKHQTDLRKSVKSLRRLRTACERAKRTLSSSNQAFIEVDSLFEGIDYSTTITRAKFESLCEDVFRRTMAPVEQVLKDAKMPKDEVHEIVLVGGSTRIPRIQQLLSDYFGGKELCKSINPDEAVAYGAAVQAAILSGVQSEKTDNIVLLDVCPLTLGIEIAGGVMEPIIKRNSTIPCKQTKTFSTYTDNQSGATIRIFQGERPMTANNQKLGQFQLDGIPPMPRGVPQLEVTYDLDANGILTVSAQEKSTGKMEKLVITSDQNTLSKEQIEKMINEAKEHEKEDTLRRERIEARNELEGYLYNVKQSMSDEKLKDKFSSEDRATVEGIVKSTLEWVEANQSETKETYNERKQQVENVVMPIMTKLYQQHSGADASSGSSSSSSNAGPRVDEVD
jgi:L1 cell adhesion molecule like protein